MSYPSGWSLQHTAPHCQRIGHGLIVSNVQGHTFRHVETPTLCASRLRLEEAPGNYALLAISLFFRGPRFEAGYTKLPLDLADLGRTGFVKFGRAEYLAGVQTGPDVSSADEARLARIVRSIRFWPLVRE